jgi:hypothetical protein
MYVQIFFFSFLLKLKIISLLNAFTSSSKYEEFNDVYIIMDANICQIIQTDLDHERISYLILFIKCDVV